MPINYHAMQWWQKYVDTNGYNAMWVPQEVPTLIITGDHDYMCPLSIFRNDTRFTRDNIEIVEVKDAGHIPWLEQPVVIAQLLSSFAEQFI